MSSDAKLGKNEGLSIGLGLISWVFPNIPTPIKIFITLIVVAIIIFMVMEKQQRQNVLSTSGKAFEYYIIPGLAGALKYFFFALIVMFFVTIVAMLFFDKADLFTSVNAFQSDTKNSPKGWLHVLWDIASHLNTLGYVVAIGAAFLGAMETIKEARPSVK